MTIVGEDCTDIMLDENGQPVADENGEFKTVRGDECWEQDLRLETQTEEENFSMRMKMEMKRMDSDFWTSLMERMTNSQGWRLVRESEINWRKGIPGSAKDNAEHII